MKKHIQQFLLELYIMDPSLREHETQLIELISRMLQEKPDVKVDETFVSELRMRLVGESIQSHSFLSRFFMNHNVPAMIGAGAALSLLLVVGIYQFTANGLSNKTPGGSIASLFQPNEIIQKKAGAFGNLALGTFQGIPEERGSAATSQVIGFGGGNALSSQDVTSRMIIAPVSYTYTYVGEPINISEQTMPVYKRLASDLASESLANRLKDAGAGMIDLSTFQNLHVQTVSLKNDRYNIQLDIEQARASIFSQYRNEPGVVEEVSLSDVPSEEALIAIANTFLQTHDIDTRAYADPVVDMQWKEQQRRIAYNPDVKGTAPPIITVIYPYALGNTHASNYNGVPEGMQVNIHIARDKVESVWNILAGNFESSQYAVETDQEKMNKFIVQGGLYTPWQQDDAALRQAQDKKQLELGTPTVVYVQHHLPGSNGGDSQEVFIPALQFPVMNKPTEGPFYHSGIVTIPLVKDILDEAGRDRPMPTEPPVTIMRNVIEPTVVSDIEQ